MRKNETLLELLMELQILDRVPRMGYPLRGVDGGESVTEHSWHVLFLVWALAPKIEGVNRARAVELALIHDVAEVRFGDLPRTASRYLPKGAKKQAESAAMAEITAPLAEEAESLFAEYQAAETAEARLVKACDKLQLMLKVTLYEEWGAGGLGEFWENPDNFPDGGFPPIRALLDQLRERREQRLALERARS